MPEQEDHILLSKQASLKRLAIPLFLVTAGIYFFVALNQFLFVCTVDYTFLFFGAMYIIFAFVYLFRSTSQTMQKMLANSGEVSNSGQAFPPEYPTGIKSQE